MTTAQPHWAGSLSPLFSVLLGPPLALGGLCEASCTPSNVRPPGPVHPDCKESCPEIPGATQGSRCQAGGRKGENNRSSAELSLQTKRAVCLLVYSSLWPIGARFWGCCPFHNEKTPSFSVDSDSQLYYCFGCHKGGTALHFVMEMERMDFQEAVKHLAERVHMEIPDAAPVHNDKSFVTSQERERIYEANVIAARYFHSVLWTDEGAEMLSYLYKRGLTDGDIRRFGLGASPKGWDTLIRYLGEKGYEPQLLKKAGLAVERDGKFYDMFRGRAIFPIINAQGKVLGFGGRAMGDAQPKYLNTPDTPVFNKRQGLYALNFARNERDAGRLVLVEGYMDTVSLRKYGVKGVVATLGTALTPVQARLIKH